MARVTSKLQVTVPKHIADQLAIRPGDEIDWIPAGDSVRVIKRAPAKREPGRTETAERLRQFDEATRRQVARNHGVDGAQSPADRGWTREELYRRRGSR